MGEAPISPVSSEMLVLVGLIHPDSIQIESGVYFEIQILGREPFGQAEMEARAIRSTAVVGKRFVFREQDLGMLQDGMGFRGFIGVDVATPAS